MTVGQGDRIPFVLDGGKNHLLPLIVNCNMQKGGLLLVQDNVSIVAQKECNGFGMAFPCGKVKRSVLSEKIEHRKSSNNGWSSFAYFSAFIVELLKLLTNLTI